MICIYLTIIYKYPYYDDMYVVTIYIYSNIYNIYMCVCANNLLPEKAQKRKRSD